MDEKILLAAALAVLLALAEPDTPVAEPVPDGPPVAVPLAVEEDVEVAFVVALRGDMIYTATQSAYSPEPTGLRLHRSFLTG